MRTNDIIVYIVEGETEQQIIKAIKNKYIVAGRIYVQNLTQSEISQTFIRTLKPKTKVVIVFDTDVEKDHAVDTLRDNIKKLRKSSQVKQVISLPQIKNIEDEIVYSTKVKTIRDLINSKSEKDFKRDLINTHESHILSALEKKHFDIVKFWSRDPQNCYCEFKNESKNVKMK
ncbi:MAG: hypothetical protein Q4A75_05505 [Peptostreptococcaceae bacterium]|nr:hypothetical protein [Peptostreptococcaceae bacterium]